MALCPFLTILLPADLRGENPSAYESLWSLSYYLDMRRCISLGVLLVSLVSACATNSAGHFGGKTSAPPQIDATGSYIFSYFRLDEIGRPLYGDEVTSITAAVRDHPTTVGPLVVVFVHGWKHDTSSHDSDMQSFRKLLDELAASQATHSSIWRRRVVGVFVDWPANDASSLGPLQNLTFWQVRDRADRVGRAGEVSKLLNHLNAVVPENHGLLLVIGHSFGARLVFESVQQTMASNVISEGKAVPGDQCTGNRVCHQVRGFGDLVVLLNPAFEAAQYTAFHQFSGGNWATTIPSDRSVYQDVEAWPTVQPPLLLVIGAKNDEATTKAWPMAHFGDDPAMTTTLTNYMPYITHEIRCLNSPVVGVPALTPGPSATDVSGILDRTLPFSPGGCGMLIPVGALSNSPFIVARADREILDGHNGIWSPALRTFIVGYMDKLHEAKRIKGW